MRTVNKETTLNAIHKFFEETVQGGSRECPINQLVPEVCSEEFFDENDVEIHHIFDEGWFVCSVCDWTMPMESMDYLASHDEFVCDGCD